ncbi:MAG: response regulator [Candidatus Omnitrophota bacterium]
MAGEKILLVDDEKIVREAFMMAFEDEYSIVSAASGDEALSILKRPNDIDLVVLDVVMPGLNGIQLVKEIKKINPGLKVAMLTGYGSKDIVIEALRADADEFIEKPFDIKQTKEVIERLLESKRNISFQFRRRGAHGKIGKAKEYIERNLNKSLHLRDVAQMSYLSPKYFSRLFKEKTGKGFNEFRVGLRIEAAKELLRKHNYSISQIAYAVGYQNPDSFMKMFKKITGLTPSQYRQRKHSGYK